MRRFMVVGCVVAGLFAAATASSSAAPSAPVHGVRASGHSDPPERNTPKGARGRKHIEGSFHVLTTDHITAASNDFTDVYRDVVEVGDQLIDVTLPAGAKVKPGDVVALDGIGDDVSLAADSVQVLSTSGEAPIAAAAASGVTSVLVILATWTAPDSVTPASASDVIFTKGNAYWNEASYGTLQLSGTVTPWQTIAAPTNGCYGGMTDLMNKAKAAALAHGYNSASYARTIVYFPVCAQASGYAGWAYQPGNQVWINGYMDTRTTIHEQGHNYGLGHAHTYDCTSGGIQVTLSTSGNCFTDEYGDPFDAMGGSEFVGQFSGPQKQKLGWLGVRKRDLASTDSVDLTPLESASGTQVARIVVSASRAYWLEYRAALGQDADFPNTGIGVQVRLVDSGVSDGGPHLLDEDPDATHSFLDAVLPPGSSWTSPEGVLIKVGAVSAASAHVDVKGGQGPPTVPAAPTAVTGKAGDAQAIVSWTKPTSDGGTVIFGYTVTASPGGATATVDSAGGSNTSLIFTGLSNGISYTFTVKARNAVGSSAASAASAPVVPNKDVPTVTVTAPAQGATVSGSNIALSANVVLSPISHSPVSSVEFQVDGFTTGTDSTSPYTGTWSTVGVDDGQHQVIAIATDSNGRVSSAPVTFIFKAPKPSVTITSPTNNANLVADSVNITATVLPGSGDAPIDTVSASIDGYNVIGYGTLDGSVANKWNIPWDLTWVDPGTHTLTVSATDTAGRTSTSDAITVSVAHPSPTVTLTSPAAGSTIHGDVDFTTNPVPNPGGGGAIADVYVVVDGTTVLGYAYASPWTVTASVRDLADGTHTFTAFATNTSGYTASSPLVTLTVANPKPRVSITAPASGATVSGSSVTLTATALPDLNTGTPISSVSFDVGGAYACTGFESPANTYSCVWDSRYGDVGVQTLTATATDDDFFVSTATRSINVSNPGPTVTITSPATGSTKSATFTTTMSVAVNPSTNAAISAVYLYLDGAYVGYDDASPWTIDVQDYNFQGPGAHTLQAQVYDADGLARKSTPITVNWLQLADPPSNLTGTPGDKKEVLHWDVPISNGGAAITDYVVQYSSNFGSTWTTFADGVSTATTATVTGLINGTQYLFQVAAKTSVGTGQYSDGISDTPCVIPGKPTGVTGTAQPNAVDVSWTPPASDGGGFISDYVVQFSIDGGTNWVAYDDGVDSSTEAFVSGLTGAPHQFRVAAVNAAGQGAFSDPSAQITPISDSYVPLLAPERLLDTRPMHITFDNDPAYTGIGRLSLGEDFQLQVAGRGDVPNDADSVVLNVTATGSDLNAGGFVTVHPCDAGRPLASNLNFPGGGTIPNAVIAKIDSFGSICLFVSNPTHLIVDVAGYFRLGSAFTPLDSPKRIFESRSGQQTYDHYAGSEPGVPVAAGGTVTLQVGGRANVPADADSAVLNVTVTGPAGSGFITVYPCGQTRPNASNLNYKAGQTIPNLVIAKLGTSGQICFYSSAQTNLIVDVSGYFAGANKLVPLPAPARLVDTRPGGVTVDALYQKTGQVGTSVTLDVLVLGRAGIDPAAQSVVLNVTVVNASGSGYITVFPCGATLPVSSNLNYASGQTIPNAVVAKVGAGGKVCIYASKATDIIVDVSGYLV